MKKRNLLLRPRWIWENNVTDLIKPYIKGKSINVCCGLSKLGDVHVDIEPKLKGVIKGSMFILEFPDESFDTVICDPPWKLNPLVRPKQFFELVRICKTGGRIIFNATWLPTSKFVLLEETYLRITYDFGQISVICLFQKTAEIK